MNVISRRNQKLSGLLVLAASLIPASHVGLANAQTEPAPQGTIYFTQCPRGSEDNDRGCLVTDDSAEGSATYAEVEIHALSADSTEPQVLTDNEFLEWAPVWSPDGSRAVVSTSAPGCQLYVLSMRDGSMEPLTEFGDEYDACTVAQDWSPNGKWILFIEHFDDDYGSNLYKIRPDGTDLTSLTNYVSEGVGVDSAAWRHDGQILFSFSSYAKERDWLYLMDAKGWHPAGWSKRVIRKDRLWIGGLFMTPDRRHLAYDQDRQGEARGEILVMRADGTHSRRLTDNRRDENIIGWSPDGKRLAFYSGSLSEEGHDDGRVEVIDRRTGSLWVRRGPEETVIDLGEPGVWGPSKNLILFTAQQRSSFATAGFVWNLDTNTTTQVTPFQTAGEVLGWLPD